MISRPDSPLEYYVHKTLVRRLLLMSLAIIVLVSITVYLLEHWRMQEYVIVKATDEVQLIVARTGTIMDEKGIDRYQAFRLAFSEHLSAPGQLQTGVFVYAGFYTPDGDLIDEYLDKNVDISRLLKQHFATTPLNKPGVNSYHVRNETLNGQPYIYVVFPITDQGQRIVAYTHAVFALSKNTQSQIQSTIWRAVTASALIILATSLLLYPVILRLVRNLSRFADDLLDANLQSISLLGSAIAKRDSDTDAHNYRVSIYAVKLAEKISLDTGSIRSLLKGAFLHDVGKIAIRDDILLKPGSLDQHEFEIMKTHVQHGLDIVKRSNWLADAKDVVGNHHEKYSGNGYPAGISGQQIPLTARIFAIADVFDALTSKRPYKQPMPLEKAMSILQESSGEHFDPELLAVFEQIAPDLYRKYSGREDDGLHEELNIILRRFFMTESQPVLK